VPSPRTPLLRYTAIAKAYDGHQPVLADINLDIAAGTSTALIGLNGAGKSTLLRLALDLITPDAGDITLRGIPARLPAARRHVAYLPERFIPPHYLTGEELLKILLQQHEVSFDSAAAAEECRQLEFDPAALKRRARDYSKGMAQKLGLIACLLAQRDFLLLDEPMSGLDPLAHRLCCARLKAAQAAGATLLFSSHALHDLAELCERVVVLHRGRIAFDDHIDAFVAQAPAADLERAFLSLIGHSS
jgi:ABC-2 type transport system ATP-binding protein